MVLGYFSRALKSKCLGEPFKSPFFNHCPEHNINYGRAKINDSFSAPARFERCFIWLHYERTRFVMKNDFDPAPETFYIKVTSTKISNLERQSRCSVREIFYDFSHRTKWIFLGRFDRRHLTEIEMLNKLWDGNSRLKVLNSKQSWSVNRNLSYLSILLPNLHHSNLLEQLLAVHKKLAILIKISFLLWNFCLKINLTKVSWSLINFSNHL